MSSYWRDWEHLIVREEPAELLACSRRRETSTLQCRQQLLPAPSAGGKLFRRPLQRTAQRFLVHDSRNGRVGEFAVDTFRDQSGTQQRRALRMAFEAQADEFLGETPIVEQPLFDEPPHRRIYRVVAESPFRQLCRKLTGGVITTRDQRDRLLVRQRELMPCGGCLERGGVGASSFDEREARGIIIRNQKKGPVVERNGA